MIDPLTGVGWYETVETGGNAITKTVPTSKGLQAKQNIANIKVHDKFLKSYKS